MKKKYNITKFNETGINNEIKMKIKINKEDINKEIYLIYNKEKENSQPHNITLMYYLDESNTELYINDKKEKYKKYFIPEKEGIYLIKLKFNICIKDCSYFFYGCKN